MWIPESLGSPEMMLEEVPYNSGMPNFLFVVVTLFLVVCFSVSHTFFLVEVCGVFGLGLCWGVWYWGGVAVTCRWRSLGSLL